MTDEEIAKLRELCEKATPGPWRQDVSCPDDVVIWGPNTDQWIANVGEPISPVGFIASAHAHDAEFIAASRTAIPKLLDMVEHLQHSLADACKTSNHWSDSYSRVFGELEAARDEIEVYKRVAWQLAELAHRVRCEFDDCPVDVDRVVKDVVDQARRELGRRNDNRN